MVFLLWTVVGLLVVGSAAGVRHRSHHRWVSPYTDLAEAMRSVTRTDVKEFRAAAGLVGLRPAPSHRAEVLDLSHARATRSEHPAAV